MGTVRLRSEDWLALLLDLLLCGETSGTEEERRTPALTYGVMVCDGGSDARDTDSTHGTHQHDAGLTS